MTASIREQIVAGMVTVLTGTAPDFTTPANGNVFRSKVNLIPRQRSPCIGVSTADERDSRFSDDYDSNVLAVDVQYSVRGDPWETLADALAVPGHIALMAWAASSPLMNSFRRESATWEAEEADLTAGVLTQRYRVVYLSNSTDITQQPS